MEVRGPNVHSSWECKFSASGSRNDQPVTRVGLEQVSLQGVLVDTIKEFGEVFDPNWLEQVDIPRARAHFTNIRRYCQMSPRIRTHEEVLDAARIATADCARYGDTTANENYLQGWVWSMEHYLGKQALDDQETEESSDDSTSHRGGIPRSQQSDEEEGCDWFMHGLRHLHSRRPFLTSSGFVGLCPWNVAIGDVLCIFLGGKTPYAVRPAAHGTYRLVGEAYVHGIMFGEFMKGEPEVREMILR